MVYTAIPGQPDQMVLPSAHTPGAFVYSFMSASGGGISLNTDGAGSAVTFSYVVPSGRSAHISRIDMILLDSDQRPSRFGGQTSLTTGCALITIDDTSGAETFNFCDGQTIKMNAEFALLAGSDIEIDSAPADDARYVRWTISKEGHPLLLNDGEGISMVIQDDLTAITDFKILVQGVLLPV